MEGLEVSDKLVVTHTTRCEQIAVGLILIVVVEAFKSKRHKPQRKNLFSKPTACKYENHK